MEKSKQTEEVYQELYKLTRIMTRALVRKYYYQFRGDVEDLAAEFFVQFITPKGRKGAPQESLLDKYDPATTSLAYLVKVCVIRKLIDQSRQHPYRVSSIDEILEAKGDVALKNYHLVDGDEEQQSMINDSRYRKQIMESFKDLPEEEKNKLFADLFDSESPLRDVLQPSIRYIHNCPIHQVTSKTAVLYIPELRTTVNFSIDDGHSRGRFHPFRLSNEDLESLKSLGKYHSQFSKELFIEFLS